MSTISADVVERTWKKMATMSLSEGQTLAMRMSKEQPFVQAYLLAVGERDFNQDEAQLLHYLGTVVWQIFDQSGRLSAMVSGDSLDRAEEANMKMLEYLEGEPETNFTKTVESLLRGYNQVEVLKYVVDALMEEPEEGCDIRDESLGSMLIHLKTIVDCFDRNQRGPGLGRQRYSHRFPLRKAGGSPPRLGYVPRLWSNGCRNCASSWPRPELGVSTSRLSACGGRCRRPWR